MATANEIIEQTIRHNPSEYYEWQQTVKYILLASGNGYFWNEDGSVEYVGELTPWEAESERQMLLALPKKIREAMLPSVKQRVIANKKKLYRIEEELSNPVSLEGKVFVDPDCLLAIAPVNVSEDWADAIYELTKDAELIFEE